MGESLGISKYIIDYMRSISLSSSIYGYSLFPKDQFNHEDVTIKTDPILDFENV